MSTNAAIERVNSTSKSSGGTSSSSTSSGSSGSSSGSGSSKDTSLKPTKEQKLAAKNQALITDADTKAATTEYNNTLKQYEMADNNAESLYRRQTVQNKQQTGADWFTQQAKLQRSVHQLNDSLGTAGYSSTMKDFMDAVEREDDEIDRETLDKQRENQNELMSDYYKVLTQNDVNRANALTSYQKSLATIQSNYLANVNNINSSLLSSNKLTKGKVTSAQKKKLQKQATAAAKKWYEKQQKKSGSSKKSINVQKYADKQYKKLLKAAEKKAAKSGKYVINQDAMPKSLRTALANSASDTAASKKILNKDRQYKVSTIPRTGSNGLLDRGSLYRNVSAIKNIDNTNTAAANSTYADSAANSDYWSNIRAGYSNRNQ